MFASGSESPLPTLACLALGGDFLTKTYGIFFSFCAISHLKILPVQTDKTPQEKHLQDQLDYLVNFVKEKKLEKERMKQQISQVPQDLFAN